MDSQRLMRVCLVPAMAGTVALAGCGGGGSSPASSATAGGAASPATATTIACPTDNTQAFPKVRFVTNVGLATGAFHRWVWKPYQAGTFKQGANGRTTALVKAGLASAFAVKQLHDAKNNVMADPAMCKVFAKPLTDLTGQLDGLKDKIAAGDLAAIETVRQSVDGVKSLGTKQGLTITDNENGAIG